MLLRERFQVFFRWLFRIKTPLRLVSAPAPMTREAFRREVFQVVGRYVDSNPTEDEDFAIEIAAFFSLLSATFFEKINGSSAKRFEKMAVRSWRSARVAAGKLDELVLPTAVNPPIEAGAIMNGTPVHVDDDDQTAIA